MKWSIASIAGFSLLLAPDVAGAETRLDDVALSATPIATWAASGCGNTLQPEGEDHPPNSCLPDEVLLAGLALWVAEALDLPAVARLPTISLVPTAGLVAIRLDAGHSEGAGVIVTSIGSTRAPDIAALYDDRTQTIHLHERWTGSTPAEMSILVHEMVHHVQNVWGLRYPCPEAREEPAYAVQAQWLALFGQSLESEFALDPLTLMVRTRCGF